MFDLRRCAHSREQSLIFLKSVIRLFFFSIILFTLQLSYAQTQKNVPPILMISVDGMRPDYITKADEHQMHVPVLRGFMQNGMYADGVVGVVPTVTFPSHATLVTGVWPEQHGIYNNTRFDPLSKNKDDWFWYENDFKVPTLWSAASQAGIKTASVFWPTTTNAQDIDYLLPAYPVRTINDVPLMEALSRPVGYLKKIEEQTGPFYIFSSGVDFDDLLTRTSIAMIRDAKPGFMTLHLVSLDYFEHLSGPFSPRSSDAMEKIDGMIGRLVEAERANNPNAIVVVVSDHGFAATHTSVNLMIPFIDAGLIQIKKIPPYNQPSIASWKAVIWNASGSAYIKLHDSKDEQTRHDVKVLLDRLQKDPRYGIARVLSNEEVTARGGDPDAAFLVEWEPGFSGGEKLEGEITTSITGTGTHGYLPDRPDLQSSFFAIGGGVSHCDVGTIDMRQIAPTLAAWMGVSLPDATQSPVRCHL
jgi:predicted AlkP superfamily pyrophosphatase or phosphodiesterase